MVNNSKNKLLFVFEAAKRKVTESNGVEKQFLAFSRNKEERFVKDDEQIGLWGEV